MNRRTIGIVGGLVVVGLVTVAVALVRTGDSQANEIGRDGWVRTDDHPTAVAVSGADGGPLRVVTRDEGSSAVLYAYRNQDYLGDAMVLEGSAEVDAHSFAAAADGPAGTPWVVVGGGETAPLVAWSSLDTPEDDAQERTSRAGGVQLPDSESAVGAVAATTEYNQVVAAVDQDDAQILIWTRYAEGPWQRSAVDLPAAGSPSRRGSVNNLEVSQDGNRFVLGAVSGDTTTRSLSLWASEEFLDEGPVSRWEPITDAPAGERVCDLVALHWSPAMGVLLGWSPLTSDGCQDEVRFTLVGHPDADPIPILEQGGEAIVSDVLALGDGTAIAVGSLSHPPHSQTGNDERVPALWARPAGEDWERVTDSSLTSQLDQEATTVSVNASSSDMESAGLVDQLLVATRPQTIGPRAIGPRAASGVSVWTWEPGDDEDDG